ncbi:DnaT-like ssDNA-binding domain-containing protein [Parendozoicomonas sp. Alg238-R29]|uniref:DnaT-like ssDNA-binding domain-containing protein n=1 Tax=Parendozoicomonas sp. Alg238-R29 TaxID=2993446 RepID=UPI00248EC5E2|nr:DnaT-like ssDNA-binding domain-containing protein [Parendozoicomonas sp. Alg238-R29]
MGDRDSDNLQRRMNREGKGLFEIMLESERPPAQESAQTFEPEVMPRSPTFKGTEFQGTELQDSSHQSFVPDLAPAQQRVRDIEQQCAEVNTAVQSAAASLEQSRNLIAEQEKQLKALRDTAREQQKLLIQKQDEQRHQQMQLESARGKLESLKRQHEQAQRQQFQQQQTEKQQIQQQRAQQQYQNTYSAEQINPDQAMAELTGRSQPAKNNILSRHRGTAVTTQARATPLAGDYNPPAWCYQKLLQNDGIPLDYAQKQLEDFKMYWLSTGEARKAWDYRFVKHVIYQWRREQSEGRTNSPRSTEEKLTDRSWANGPLLDFDD